MPGDIRACLGNRVSGLPEGTLSRRVVFSKLAELKADSDAKRRCGQRLMCWIEDIARGLNKNVTRRRPVDPACTAAPVRPA